MYIIAYLLFYLLYPLEPDSNSILSHYSSRPAPLRSKTGGGVKGNTGLCALFSSSPVVAHNVHTPTLPTNQTSVLLFLPIELFLVSFTRSGTYLHGLSI